MISLTILLLLALAVPLAAQVTKRDPLTDAESDQLREVAMEPDKRLKLIIKFAQARLVRRAAAEVGVDRGHHRVLVLGDEREQPREAIAPHLE